MDIAFLPALSTYGRPLAQRDLGGIALSLGAHLPGDSVPAHRHEDTYQWCLTLEGGFEEFAGGHVEQCGAGSLLVRPPDCVHADRFSRMRGLCLNLFPQAAWLTENRFEPLRDTYVHFRTRRLLALGHELASALDRPEHESFELEGLVVELLASVVRLDDLASQGHPPWLAAAIDLIEADLSARVRLGDVAAQIGVSAGHLARAFRARFGRSIGTYVRERRLARAADLLRESKKPLAEIAAAAGFYDQAHFTHAFRARFGATPATFRRRE